MPIIIDKDGRREVSQVEFDAYITATTVWSKEAHLQEINALHKEEFLKRIALAGYEDREEFNATLADARSQWHEEAKAINTYWLNGEIAIDNYAETVTEETAQDPISFVSLI